MGEHPLDGAPLPVTAGETDLVAAVRSTLDAHLGDGAAVAVAVSGGPDSTALLHLTAAARADLTITAVHVRHGLRDDVADARAAAAHAAALGLPLLERAAVVDGGDGPEAAARDARYAALAGAAAELGTTAVLVGHTADDQAETVLLNIARGSGLPGLAAMDTLRVRADGLRVLRPLLRARRASVRRIAEATGLAVATDPTNADPDQRRARARAELLPALARLAGPGDPVAALARLATHARRDTEALDDLAAAEADRLVVTWGPAAAVRRDELDALPPALATRVVRRLLGDAAARDAGGQAPAWPSAAAVDRALRLEAGQAADLAEGVVVSAGGGWLAAVPRTAGALPERSLQVPGHLALPELGLVLHAASGTVEPAPLAAAPPGAVHPACVRLPHPAGDAFAVRTRRPGDRVTDGGGTSTVADRLVDAGVPRALRHLLPVVTDAAGTVVWVPGLARAHGAPDGVTLWLAPG